MSGLCIDNCGNLARPTYDRCDECEHLATLEELGQLQVARDLAIVGLDLDPLRHQARVAILDRHIVRLRRLAGRVTA